MNLQMNRESDRNLVFYQRRVTTSGGPMMVVVVQIIGS
jgi:hypothetical protein